jgi:hypothetical protein
VTVVLAILLVVLIAEVGAALFLAVRALKGVQDRQEVFNKYAKAVGRESLTQTREAEKALARTQGLFEDTRRLQGQLEEYLGEVRRGR